MKKDIEKFTGKLKMCSHSVNRYGFDERIWMIANEDENWAVSFREEEEREGEFIVKIHKIDTNKTKFDLQSVSQNPLVISLMTILLCQSKKGPLSINSEFFLLQLRETLDPLTLLELLSWSLFVL